MIILLKLKCSIRLGISALVVFEINELITTNMPVTGKSARLYVYILEWLDDSLTNKYEVVKQYQIKTMAELLRSEIDNSHEKANWQINVIRLDFVKGSLTSENK